MAGVYFAPRSKSNYSRANADPKLSDPLCPRLGNSLKSKEKSSCSVHPRTALEARPRIGSPISRGLFQFSLCSAPARWARKRLQPIASKTERPTAGLHFWRQHAGGYHGRGLFGIVQPAYLDELERDGRTFSWAEYNPSGRREVHDHRVCDAYARRERKRHQFQHQAQRSQLFRRHML